MAKAPVEGDRLVEIADGELEAVDLPKQRATLRICSSHVFLRRSAQQREDKTPEATVDEEGRNSMVAGPVILQISRATARRMRLTGVQVRGYSASVPDLGDPLAAGLRGFAPQDP